jgi:signal peptidase I
VSLQNGQLEIDGQPLALDTNASEVQELFGERIARLNLEAGGGPAFTDLRIPDGFVLVLGDHRGNSRDSRSFGLVSTDSLYGRALGIYFRREEGLTWRPL